MQLLVGKVNKGDASNRASPSAAAAPDALTDELRSIIRDEWTRVSLRTATYIR
jgi:hypothetical protein